MPLILTVCSISDADAQYYQLFNIIKLHIPKIIHSSVFVLGVGAELLHMFSTIAADSGYLGISGRMAITARSPLPGTVT